MRAFALCRRPFCQPFIPYLGRAHASFRSQAFANGSAIEHLASGAAATAWLYDLPSMEPEAEVSNSKLVKLVHEARYGAADRLRLQLREKGVPIQQHPVYRKAALAALQWEDPSACVDLFSAWFSLLPQVTETKSTPNLDPIRHIRNAILRSGSPATRRSLVKQFALMCASKGYVYPIYDEVVKLVARFATPTEGATFLLQYEEAIKQYHRDIHPERVKATERRYRIAAIEVCCQAGWLDEAVGIVQLERDFALPDQTYRLLLQTLHERRTGPITVVEHLRLLDEFKRDTKAHPQLPKPTASVPSVYDTQSLRASKPPKTSLPLWEPIPVSRTAVAAQLRALRSVLSAPHPPSQTRLLPFLRNATRVGVTPRTLLLLRTKAMSRGAQLATRWLHAELMFHASEANHIQVLTLFVEHVPASSILSPAFERTLHDILRARKLHLRTSTLIPEIKISKHDHWMLHKAIIILAVHLPRRLTAIPTLYTAYLASTTMLKGSSRVFAAFIWAFAECGSLREAALVSHDMQTKGLVPNIRQDVMLAWAYARAGDVDKAMGLLTMIEDRMREIGTNRLVMPQLVVYGRVIKGFMQADLFVQAREVEKRMKRTVSYTRGLNRHLDKMLDSLSSKTIDRSVSVNKSTLDLTYIC